MSGPLPDIFSVSKRESLEVCWFCISSHVHGEDITDFSHEGKHRLNAFGELKFDEKFFFSPSPKHHCTSSVGADQCHSVFLYSHIEFSVPMRESVPPLKDHDVEYRPHSCQNLRLEPFIVFHRGFLAFILATKPPFFRLKGKAL